MKYDTNVKSWSVVPSIVLPGASVNSQCILLPGNPNAGPPAIPDKILIFINTDQYTTSAAATIFNTGTSAFETVTNADNLNSLAGACAINLKVAPGPVMLWQINELDPSSCLTFFFNPTHLWYKRGQKDWAKFREIIVGRSPVVFEKQEHKEKG